MNEYMKRRDIKGSDNKIEKYIHGERIRILFFAYFLNFGSENGSLDNEKDEIFFKMELFFDNSKISIDSSSVDFSMTLGKADK